MPTLSDCCRRSHVRSSGLPPKRRAGLVLKRRKVHAGLPGLRRGGQQDGVVKDSSLHHRSLYCHPLLFSNLNPCWEAERERRTDCLAVENAYRRRKLGLEEQVCTSCNMRAYAAIAAVELPKRDTDLV